MKITAFRDKDYNFTASLWSWTVETQSDGSDKLVYAYNRDIKLVAVSGTFGKMNVYFQDIDSDIEPKYQLVHLRGPDGVELSNNAAYQVDAVAPFINMWGRREGYKGRISFIGLSS